MEAGGLFLYDRLVPWYRLLDPVEDHRDEAAHFAELLTRGLSGTASGAAPELLELGAGAGNNASFLKAAFNCTLTDVSEGMLALSRQLNPECPHALGDMRSLRLQQTFDAVLVHDAICYMTTVDDLRAAIATAYAHTRPGGVVLLAPDDVREDFEPGTQSWSNGDGDRELQTLQWCWDPDPSDTMTRTDYAFLARDGDDVIALHDVHSEGLFPRQLWVDLCRDAGFAAVEVHDGVPQDGETQTLFLGRRSR